MNILILVDISVWKNKHMKELLDIINEYAEDPYDKNKLLLSPNPLMTISLACEILDNIIHERKKFDNECIKVKNGLLELGKMYTNKIEDEPFYERQIMGIDFKKRTVLKTITSNKYIELMP